MGKQPSILIIARHGTRLDQADKEWQNNSDQPWDSPLSYGGWIQAQNLGARIATELQNLESPLSNEGSNKENSPTNARPRKRRKVTIHSSPYLRCIQTSLGIAAGLRYPQDIPRVRPIPTPFQRSSLSKPPMLVSDKASSPPEEKILAPAPALSPPANFNRPINGLTELKIDAWLGEWLSSGYFEKSKPPPPSEELVETAKKMLKRAPEEIKGADVAKSIQEFDEFDWSDTAGDAKEPKEVKDTKDAKDVKTLPIHEKTGLRAMAAKGHSMSHRSRGISLSTVANGNVVASEPVGRRPRSTTYSPPIPTYSIAPQDSIPIGYVAHARDACVDTDFEWDSQQPPLEWGDGGKYEEEWSTMHRRFRVGLQSMLQYYETEYPDDLDSDQDADEDLVVILVTHQAGCNALIRLVTGAPALHDVGTASLTLAVRKPGLTREQSVNASASPRRRGSLDLGLNNEFEMKIIASVEHLRSGSNPLGLNSPRLAMSPAFAGRRMVGAESLEGFSIGDPLTWRSSSQTTVGRSSSVRGHHSSGSWSSIAPPENGLWSMGHTRTTSNSSDTSVDPRSIPTSNPKVNSGRISTNVIIEDEAIEDWAAAGAKNSQTDLFASPISVHDQSIWEPAESTATKRFPIRKDSTVLSGNSTAGTGLWGSPVNNPGGVKEGTPHSKGSFGENDNVTPIWGARSSGRSSWQSKKESFSSSETLKEE